MYLHIGNGKNVREKQIIGVFDLDSASFSPITRDFLATAEKRCRTLYEDSDIPRSFVLTYDGKYDKVLLSKISAQRLCARAEGYDGEEE